MSEWRKYGEFLVLAGAEDIRISFDEDGAEFRLWWPTKSGSVCCPNRSLDYLKEMGEKFARDRRAFREAVS